MFYETFRRLFIVVSRAVSRNFTEPNISRIWQIPNTYIIFLLDLVHHQAMSLRFIYLLNKGDKPMPITFTFDIDDGSVQDQNDRTRIIAAFKRFGWEHIGGSAWRYPALGTQNTSEDWLNHVIPALMYFRCIVEHANLNVYNFTIDAHSEAGHRGRANPPLGQPIHSSAEIEMYSAQNYDTVLSENRLRKFMSECANCL